MATLDDVITNEKERLGEALARAGAQREKLVHQLSELATERVPPMVHGLPAFGWLCSLSASNKIPRAAR